MESWHHKCRFYRSSSASQASALKKCHFDMVITSLLGCKQSFLLLAYVT